MSSGSLTSNDLEHQAQWVAADVDKNGAIQAKDAWLINRYAATQDFDGNYTGNWDFIASNASLEELSKDYASIPGAASIESISIDKDPKELNLTAILRGDIDGSYINYI